MYNPEEANEKQRSAESTLERSKQGWSQNRSPQELSLVNKVNPPEKKLSQEAKEYKNFKKDFKPINMATIKEELGDRIKHPHISINSVKKEFVQSSNKVQVRIKQSDPDSTCKYRFSISCFKIDVTAYFKHKDFPSLGKESSAGSGSFGEVHLVKNSRGQEVCLKLIRFRNNIQPYFSLRDAIKEFGMCKLADVLGVGPHVQSMKTEESKIKQVDILVYYDGIAFQMEKCELVEDRIAVIQPQAQHQEQLGKIERELGEAMLTLHEFKIVHKDIKPQNTVYSPSKRRYCLIDFGLSHSVKETYEGKTQTYCEGTLNYMSKEMQSLLKAEKRKGEVNLYYNDLHAYRHSLEVIRGYASGKKTMPARTIRKAEDFQIKRDGFPNSDEEILSQALFYDRINQGFNEQIFLFWMTQIQEMSSEQKRAGELKRMEKYRKRIESSPQYKFQKRMDQWDRRMVPGYQYSYQGDDIRVLFSELSQPQPDYQQVLRCLMNLRRVNGLIEVRFWKIETLLNDVIFPYIDDKYSQDQFRSLYYRIVQRVINLADVEARTHQQLAEAKYQQELQGIQEDVNKLIKGYQQQEELFELLCDLSEFCCHFNVCSALDVTLEYLDLRNPFSPEEIVVLLGRCVLELQKHPQRSQSKIAAYIVKIISIAGGQRHQEILQDRDGFYEYFLLSMRSLQIEGKLFQEVEYYIYTAGVIQLKFLRSPELYRSILYNIYLLQSSENNRPIWKFSEFSELYESLIKDLGAYLFRAAMRISTLQRDYKIFDSQYISQQVSLIKPMFGLLFDFIGPYQQHTDKKTFFQIITDTKFQRWLVQWLMMGPRYQSQRGGANLYFEPLLSQMSQEQLRYRAHMYFFPFHQHLVHSKVLRPLFCEADQECGRLIERLIEPTYNIRDWEEVAERMTQHLRPPKQMTEQQIGIAQFNSNARMVLRKNPESMQRARSKFRQLNKQLLAPKFKYRRGLIPPLK